MSMQQSTSLPLVPYRSAPHTKPDVFIIESLDFDDEDAGMFEGRVIAKVLRMCGKEPRYNYFRTKQELVRIAERFRDSSYRYLHVSTHGASDALYTTLKERIAFDEFASIFAKSLSTKRLFVSACQVGGEELCKAVAETNKGMQSVAAPTTSISSLHAVALWTSLYARAFAVDTDGMRHQMIREALEGLCSVFDESFHLSLYAAEKDAWNHHRIGR